MCGICGIIKFNNSTPETEKLQKMMRVMKHRGPDDEGIFIDSNIGFGFVRLSILDLSSLGHQPMVDSTGRYMIIHNGEVYNFIELRDELIKKGYKFKSNTDTEVILYAYIEWGKSCLHKLNGMWAFTIFDRKSKEIFIARDRYGIKPFYYYRDQNQLIFASEIPPILSVLNFKPEANNQTIFDYLVFNRTDQTEATFFEGIKKLQHGHYITIKNSTFKIEKWYDLRERLKRIEGFRSGEEYRELFSSAVGLRLRSDVPVGVCLSGGLDSSSIVSVLVNDYKKKDLNTFSAVYGHGKRGDESPFIDEFRAMLSNMFFTNPSAQSLYDDIHRFIRAHAEPIPSTAPYAQFKVMELSKGNVVVTLDGQGADEELAGYHYFYGYFFKDLVKNYKLFRFFNECIHYIKLHRSLYGVKTFAYFTLPTKLKTKTRLQEKGYLNHQFAKAFSDNNVIASHLYDSQSLSDALLDHFEFKLEHLLKWEDRNSMYFSLEARVPFLDYRLVEKTLASSSKWIIKDGWTKYILRQAMRDTLPEKIRYRRDKIGFMTPEDEWFREKHIQNFVYDLLDSDSFKQRGIVDPVKAKRLYQLHLDKKIQASKEIWKWIHLELWFREFID